MRLSVKNVIKKANIINIGTLNIYIGGEEAEFAWNAREAMKIIWDKTIRLGEKMRMRMRRIREMKEEVKKKNEIGEALEELHKIKMQLEKKDPELARKIGEIIAKIHKGQEEERNRAEKALNEAEKTIKELGEEALNIRKTIAEAKAGLINNNRNKVNKNDIDKLKKAAENISIKPKTHIDIYIGKKYEWLGKLIAHYCITHEISPSELGRQALINYLKQIYETQQQTKIWKKSKTYEKIHTHSKIEKKNVVHEKIKILLELARGYSKLPENPGNLMFIRKEIKQTISFLKLLKETKTPNKTKIAEIINLLEEAEKQPEVRKMKTIIEKAYKKVIKDGGLS